MPVYRRNASDIAKQYGIKYTVGIGTNGMAMFPYAIAQMGSFIPNDEG
jgi:Ca-activated chloride channel family protein